MPLTRSSWRSSTRWRGWLGPVPPFSRTTGESAARAVGGTASMVLARAALAAASVNSGAAAAETASSTSTTVRRGPDAPPAHDRRRARAHSGLMVRILPGDGAAGRAPCAGVPRRGPGGAPPPVRRARWGRLAGVEAEPVTEQVDAAFVAAVGAMAEDGVASRRAWAGT